MSRSINRNLFPSSRFTEPPRLDECSCRSNCIKHQGWLQPAEQFSFRPSVYLTAAYPFFLNKTREWGKWANPALACTEISRPFIRRDPTQRSARCWFFTRDFYLLEKSSPLLYRCASRRTTRNADPPASLRSSLPANRILSRSPDRLLDGRPRFLARWRMQTARRSMQVS